MTISRRTAALRRSRDPRSIFLTMLASSPTSPASARTSNARLCETFGNHLSLSDIHCSTMCHVGLPLPSIDTSQELCFCGPCMVSKHTAHCGCSGNDSRSLNPTHGHTQVLSLEEDGDSKWFKLRLQEVCNVDCQVLLYVQTLRQRFDCTRDLG